MNNSESKIEWGKMNKWELEQRSEFVDLAILPIGSVEQHGPHLPLSTDTYNAESIVKEAVKQLDSEKPPILPTLPYGVSQHNMSFPGTVSIESGLQEKLIIQIGRSIIHHGFLKMYIFCGHDGSFPAVKNAARKLKEETGMKIIFDSFDLLAPEKEKHIKSDNDVHAGEFETSITLSVKEELVDERTIPKKEHEFSDPKLEFDHESGLNYAWSTHDISETGVIGDASEASKELGSKMRKSAIEKVKGRLETIIDL